MSRVRRLAGLLSCILATAGVARAHQGHPILHAERTIKLEADGERGIRMVVTVNLGQEEMLRTARNADLNGDGRIDAHEVEKHVEAWATTLARVLPVRVDGSFVHVSYVEPFFDPKGPIQLRPGTLELVGIIVIGSGRHEILVTDETPPEQFERTDVMFTATHEAQLLASGPTDAPVELVPSFAYGTATERRRVHSIGMVVEMPQPPEGSLPKPRSVGLTKPLALLLAQTAIAVLLGRALRAIRARNRERGQRRP